MKTKFDKKSFNGILVSYEQSCYKILNVETNKFITARDVVIDEVNYNTLRPPLYNKEIIEFENIDAKNEN